MRVWRVVRFLLPFAIVLVVVAGVVALFSARPEIENARRDVDEAWTPLAAQLTEQYVRLDAADDKLRGLSGPVSELANDMHDAIGTWQQLQGGDDLAAQVRAANTVESLSRRLVTAAQVSERVKGNKDAEQAILVIAAKDPSDAVTAFNAAVISYEEERRGPVRSIIASATGHERVPVYAQAPTA
jgi:hypothetical protein